MREWGTKEWFESQFEGESDLGDKWGHRWRSSQKIRHKQIIQFVEMNQKSIDIHGDVLDVGCAVGDFTNSFIEKYPNCKLTGVDISSRAVEIVSKRILSGSFLQASLPVLPFQQSSFDGILIIEVLYYLNDMDREESIRRVEQLLKPEGWCCITAAIDNGERYFSEEGIIKLVSIYFDVKSIGYHHSKLYGYIERPLLLIIQVASFVTNGDSNTNSFKKKMLLKTMQVPFFGVIAKKVFIYAGKMSNKVLQWSFIPSICFMISKWLVPQWSKSGIMLFLTKK